MIKNMHESDGLVIPFIDYTFWSLLILFTNPGGIVEAFNAHYIVGKVQINDLLFVLLSFCYFIIPKSFNNLDADFKKIKIYLLIFLTYYFVFHTFIVPILNGTKNYSLLISLIKSRHTLYHIFIFIYIYEFFKRRWDIFIIIFTYSSVIILILFLLQLIIMVNILPVFSLNRHFINIARNMMISEGLIPLLIPLGVVLLIFKLNIKHKNIILLGFALLPIYYIVSLIRKEMISIFIYFFIASLISVFLSNRYKVIVTNALKALVILVILIVGSYFIFPKYVEAARLSLIETYNVIQYGKTSTGQKDERLGLNRIFIVGQFLRYPIFGTGFDNRWRGGPGEKEGYESSDYPLLSAFAMFGLVGIIVFLPIYVVMIKVLKKDIIYLRNNKIKKQNLLFLFLMTFILFFVFHLLQYFNWFFPVSCSDYYSWYFFLSLYLATRNRFYFLQNPHIISTDNMIQL